MKKTVAVMLLVLGLVALSQAEFRIWSSKDGASNIEAQFLRMTGSSVVLEKRDGEEVTVPRKLLSDADQKYLSTVIPPELNIAVKVDENKEKLKDYDGYAEELQIINMQVAVKKVSPEPCNWNCEIHAYLVAKSFENEERKVIAYVENDMDMGSEKLKNFTLEGKAKKSEGLGIGKRGWGFEGYIVMVTAGDGKIVCAECSEKEYQGVLHKFLDDRSLRNGTPFSL